MGRVLGMTRLQLYLQHDRPLTPAEKDALRPMIARRGAGEPLAYVLGDQEFHGHVIEVDAAVLIPRPETEELVELALERLPAGAQRVVDLGTGSGAIAATIALAREDVRVDAVDVSAEALAVAARNLARHGLEGRVRLLCGSWWEPVDAALRFDLVVANPPYVDPARPELLADDVRRHEPAGALFTPAGDPAFHYRAIAAGAAERLVAGGWVVCETGVGADEPARAALRAAGFEDVELREDLAGQPRHLLARR